LFFVASKLLGILISPLVWVVILFVWSFLAKNKSKQQLLKTLGFALTLIFSNPFLANWCLSNWETQGIPKDQIPLCNTAVILGGMIEYNAKQPQDQLSLNSSFERLAEGLRLYKQGVVRKLIISGGNGSIDQTIPPESVDLQNLANELVGPSNILIDSMSRNTHENALQTRAILEDLGLLDQPVLLITSAYHMKRAVNCFKKNGVSAIPFSVDFRSSPVELSIDIFIPTPNALSTWNILFKEWVGLVTYQLIGYT